MAVEERLQACPKPSTLSWMALPAPGEEPLPQGRPELRLLDALTPILKSPSGQALQRHSVVGLLGADHAFASHVLGLPPVPAYGVCMSLSLAALARQPGQG